MKKLHFKNNVLLNKIITINYNNKIFKSKKELKKITKLISEGNLIIFRKFINSKKVEQIKKYLTVLAKNSLPNYEKIHSQTHNHHRVMRSDERSHVKGAFHQFSFFPWNQDVFNFFDLFNEGFYLKNLISNNKKNQYLSTKPKSITARVCFQFYPAGEGYLNCHSDPVGKHQITAPILVMSKKGLKGDFKKGGSYVLNKNKKKIFIERYANIGDIVMYNAKIPHGVEIIDPQKKVNWLDFKGRWMMLFATNKLYHNKIIKNSKDFEKK